MFNFLLKYSLTVIPTTISMVSLFLIHRFANVWVFFIVFVLWVVSVALLNRFFTNQKITDKEDLFALTITTIVSLIGLLVLIESVWLCWFIIVFGGFLIGTLFVISLYQEHQDDFNFKPIRRMLMMLWVFDAYAVVTAIIALSVFFVGVPFWVWGIAGGVFYGYIAVMIWRQYFAVGLKFFFVWGLLIGLVMFELLWVMHLLPFGYLVLGFFVTWLWYLLQLFIRFHLTPQKVVWRKQRWFLVSNFVFYVFLLFFVVRWI